MDILSIILKLLVVLLASVLLSVVALQVIKNSGADLKDTKQRNNPKVLLIAGFFNLLFIAAVALILWVWDNQSLEILGFSMRFSDLIFIIVVIAVSLFSALLYIFVLKNRKRISFFGNENFLKNTGKSLSFWLALIVLFIAALQEEILFRGYFAYVLMRFGFYYALIVSALVFTFWHFLTNKVSLFQTFDWFLGGVMLFCIYWLSGTIWVAAMVHFSRNLTNVLVFDISGENSIVSFEKPIQPQYKTLYLVLYSILVILLGLFFYRFL